MSFRDIKKTTVYVYSFKETTINLTNVF